MPSTTESVPLKVVPFAGLDVRRGDGPPRSRRTAGHPSRPWRRSPATARSRLRLRDVDLGIREDPISVVGGETADVIGVEVRDRTRSTCSGV